MFRLDAAGSRTRALLAVRVAVAAGARRRHHGVHGVSVFARRGASVSQILAFVLPPIRTLRHTVRRAFARLIARLVVQQLDEEVDVLHGESQYLVLAELLVRRVGRDEFTELGESAVHVLLPPALTAVREDAPSQLLRRT